MERWMYDCVHIIPLWICNYLVENKVINHHQHCHQHQNIIPNSTKLHRGCMTLHMHVRTCESVGVFEHASFASAFYKLNGTILMHTKRFSWFQFMELCMLYDTRARLLCVHKTPNAIAFKIAVNICSKRERSVCALIEYAFNHCAQNTCAGKQRSHDLNGGLTFFCCCWWRWGWDGAIECSYVRANVLHFILLNPVCVRVRVCVCFCTRTRNVRHKLYRCVCVCTA